MGIGSPSSLVNVIVRDDTQQLYIEKELKAGEDGNIEFSFKLEADAKPGTWSMEVANGNDQVILEFDVEFPNDNAPETYAQSLLTNADTAIDITLEALDVDGDILSFSIQSDPSNGMLSGSAPDLTYIPDPNFSGDDSFTFRVSDGSLESKDSIVTITVSSVSIAETSTFTITSSFNGDNYSISGVSENVMLITFTVNPEQSVEIELDGEGELELTLPKNLIDGIMVVSSEGRDIPFEEIESSSSFTTITFTVPGQTASVEIYGATVVPEFSTVMALVMSMSFLIFIGFTRAGRGSGISLNSCK